MNQRATARMVHRALLAAMLAMAGITLGAPAHAGGDPVAADEADALEVSTVQDVGDFSYVQHADGSTAVFHRVGDVSQVIDSRPHMSGMAHHLGEAVYIQRDAGLSACMRQGDLLMCTRQRMAVGASTAWPRAATLNGTDLQQSQPTGL